MSCNNYRIAVKTSINRHFKITCTLCLILSLRFLARLFCVKHSYSFNRTTCISFCMDLIPNLLDSGICLCFHILSSYPEFHRSGGWIKNTITCRIQVRTFQINRRTCHICYKSRFCTEIRYISGTICHFHVRYKLFIWSNLITAFTVRRPR